MGENDFVTQKQHNESIGKVYDRINGLDRGLARIFGGIAVVSFLAAFVVGIVAFSINQRFLGVEKSIDKMDTRLIEVLKQSK